MRILVFLWAVSPLIITSLIVFFGSQAQGGLALLMLMVLNKLPLEDAVSSIEHKLDHLAKATLSAVDDVQNYTRLHKTNWDHDYPMRVDEEMRKYGKQRSETLIFGKLFTSFGTIIIFLAWVFMLVKS